MSSLPAYSKRLKSQFTNSLIFSRRLRQDQAASAGHPCSGRCLGRSCVPWRPNDLIPGDEQALQIREWCSDIFSPFLISPITSSSSFRYSLAFVRTVTRWMTQCSACLHDQTQEVQWGNGCEQTWVQIPDIDVTNTRLILLQEVPVPFSVE